MMSLFAVFLVLVLFVSLAEDVHSKVKCGCKRPRRNKPYVADVLTFLNDKEPFEGDMILTHSQKLEMLGFRNTVPTRKLWKGGVVIYKIQDDVHKSKCWDKLIKKSLRDLTEETGGCIKFRLATSKDKDYVNVVYGPICSSMVGRIGGAQRLNLGEKCNTIRAIQHEFIHALGFSHEQSRSDRDKHVKIHWENIDSRKCYNFNVRGILPKQAYDIDSIMHYRHTEFSCNGNRTISTRLGEGYDNCGMITDIDVEKIRALYKCK